MERRSFLGLLGIAPLALVTKGEQQPTEPEIVLQPFTISARDAGRMFSHDEAEAIAEAVAQRLGQRYVLQRQTLGLSD